MHCYMDCGSTTPATGTIGADSASRPNGARSRRFTERNTGLPPVCTFKCVYARKESRNGEPEIVHSGRPKANASGGAAAIG